MTCLTNKIGENDQLEFSTRAGTCYLYANWHSQTASPAFVEPMMTQQTPRFPLGFVYIVFNCTE
jgi:hypothetical protein